jgi:hypothetical protein
VLLRGTIKHLLRTNLVNKNLPKKATKQYLKRICGI